jgi:hypothetical protein
MMLPDLRHAPTQSVFVTLLAQVYARPLVAAIAKNTWTKPGENPYSTKQAISLCHRQHRQSDPNRTKKWATAVLACTHKAGTHKSGRYVNDQRQGWPGVD